MSESGIELFCVGVMRIMWIVSNKWTDRMQL